VSDRIRLSGLRVFAHHGVLAHEKDLGQVLVVDLDVAIDLAPAAASDDLADTLDYGALAAAAAALVGSTSHDLLEAVAGDLAELVMRDARVSAVTVTVTKPSAPLPVDAQVSVQLTRTRR
jgi:dihydroneopterin aldolase